MKVLIVESDSDLADSVGKTLQHWGHKTHKCGSGKDALKNATEMVYDLVLTEALLPDMRGDELIARLKSLSPDTRVVAMTWKNSRELETRIREQGILYYMVKPFEAESFKSLLEHLSRSSKEAKTGRGRKQQNTQS